MFIASVITGSNILKIHLHHYNFCVLDNFALRCFYSYFLQIIAHA